MHQRGIFRFWVAALVVFVILRASTPGPALPTRKHDQLATGFLAMGREISIQGKVKLSINFNLAFGKVENKNHGHGKEHSCRTSEGHWDLPLSR